MRWKKDWRFCMLIFVGVAINLLGAQLALSQGWMLFLDAIGTVLVTAMGGMFPGVTVGFLSNALNSFADPITMYYGIISVLIALATGIMARRGAFRTVWRMLLCALVLSLIGGGLGSGLTWLLYGFSFGTGISAPLSHYLNAHTSMGMFFSQFSADMAIDLADKLLTVGLVAIALRLLPKGLRQQFPMAQEALGHVQSNTRLSCRHSLRKRFIQIVILASVVLSTLSIVISFSLYRATTNEAYVEQCESAVALMRDALNGDEVERFLESGQENEAYRTAEGELYRIRDAFPNVVYMYVYQIREDGCHVVFDLNTPELEGGALGDVIDFDDAFLPQLPRLLRGEEIEPIISNGQYGWLLTVYQPVRNAAGRCVAYAAADVQMENVITDQFVFIIRLVALLFGGTIVIMAFVLRYAERRMVEPINAMADAALGYAQKQGAERVLNAERMQALHISTGDELENLYGAICKTFQDAAEYLDEIKRKNEVINRLQDNIILSLANIVESRDENTGCHIKRTAAYVADLAWELRRSGRYSDILTDEYCENMIKSAPLHDVGKIDIPDSILNKPGRLTPEEFDVIKTHTDCGLRLLQAAMEGVEGDTYLTVAADMAAYHHEKWDGTGYNKGLRGDDIPICARIMAVADVLDALVSKRSYKPALPFDEAARIIRAESGTHFDPAVVEAFDAIEAQMRKHSEGCED